MAESSDEDPLFPDISGLEIADDVALADEHTSGEDGMLRQAPLSAASLPDDVSDTLLGSGYCVCPDSAGMDWCSDVRAEVETLHRLGHLETSPNRLSTVRGKTGSDNDGAVCVKNGVFELPLVLGGKAVAAPEVWRAAPSLARWWHGNKNNWCNARDEALDRKDSSNLEDVNFEGRAKESKYDSRKNDEVAIKTSGDRPGSGCIKFMDAINAAAPWLQLSDLDTMKVQYNDGTGGCFPLHRDTVDSSGRRCTAILYLTEGWTSADGGELRLLPFPLEPLNVAPHSGTLVLFSSVNTLHRVLPSYKPRCAVSLWFNGLGGSSGTFPSRFPSWCSAQHAQGLAFLRNHSHAIVLTKILYQDEFAQSTREAFAGQNEAVEAALELHFKEVAALEKGTSAVLLSRLRAALPLCPPAPLTSPSP